MEYSGDRSLRLITVVDWIPALAFLLPNGIRAHSLFPVLGILPMTLSAVTGLVHIAGYARLRWVNLLVDLFLALFLLGMLIPGLILMANGPTWQYYWGDNYGNTILGTYGTVPMILNIAIHAYFVLRQIRFRWPVSVIEHCPKCHGDLPRPHRVPKGYKPAPAEYEDAEESDDSKETFHPVQEESRASSSKQPRPSTDDESARLV